MQERCAECLWARHAIGLCTWDVMQWDAAPGNSNKVDPHSTISARPALGLRQSPSGSKAGHGMQRMQHGGKKGACAAACLVVGEHG